MNDPCKKTPYSQKHEIASKITGVYSGIVTNFIKKVVSGRQEDPYGRRCFRNYYLRVDDLEHFLMIDDAGHKLIIG